MDFGLVLTALVVGALGAVSLRRRGGATPDAPPEPVEPQPRLDRRPHVSEPDSEGLGVDDLDATFEKIRASGAEVLQEPTSQPWGARDCAFRDPSGNLVRIAQA